MKEEEKQQQEAVEGQEEEQDLEENEEKGGAGPGIRNLLNAHKSLQIMERGSGQRLWEYMGTIRVRGD